VEDSQIVELYWQRNEYAISETQQKYGQYCFAIANQILYNDQDAEEIVNDAYAGAWNAIPPHKPEILRTFIGKITRQLSLKKLREKTAEKRGGGEIHIAFDELEECVPTGYSIEDHMEIQEITNAMNRFLDVLSEDERRVFLCRYWYFDSISDIAKRFGFGQSKVKMMLLRTRNKLLAHLKTEGVVI